MSKTSKRAKPMTAEMLMFYLQRAFDAGTDDEAREAWQILVNSIGVLLQVAEERIDALQEQNRRLRSDLEYHKAKHQWPGQTLTELPTGQWVPHPSNDFRGQEPPDA